MTPRPAARDAARAALRPARVAVGGDGVEIGCIPIAAPFVDVLAHAVQAVPIRRACRDALGTGEGARRVIGRVVAPRIAPPLGAAPRGTLPLRLRRQSKPAAEPF